MYVLYGLLAWHGLHDITGLAVTLPCFSSLITFIFETDGSIAVAMNFSNKYTMQVRGGNKQWVSGAGCLVSVSDDDVLARAQPSALELTLWLHVSLNARALRYRPVQRLIAQPGIDHLKRGSGGC